MKTFETTSPLLYGTLMAVVLIVGCGEGAKEGTGELPLPAFESCAPSQRPLLPEKWRATALLQDFTADHLAFGNFVNDASARAFRFQLTDRYGTNLDFLVTDEGKLYALEGGEVPSSCRYETANSPFATPPRDWLDPQATCTGRAPLLDIQQDWWKTRPDESSVGADWVWFGTESRLPFRVMYYEDPAPGDRAPIYEYFSFNYFPTFEEASETDLAQLRRLCEETTDQPTPTRAWEEISIDALFSSNQFPRPTDQPLAIAQQWIPEMRECASVDSLPPPWPERLQLTGLMTAVRFDEDPFPTRIFYDWSSRLLNTTLYPNPLSDQKYALVARLLGDTGYFRHQYPDGTVDKCEQSLPGPPVPDWKRVDGCECRAEIAPGSTLNPSATTTKILWCPTDLSKYQVFWTWYEETGKPVTFMQTRSSPTDGTGLNLADYSGWLPGSDIPADAFNLPLECEGAPKIAVPDACHNCHLPLGHQG